MAMSSLYLYRDFGIGGDHGKASIFRICAPMWFRLEYWTEIAKKQKAKWPSGPTGTGLNGPNELDGPKWARTSNRTGAGTGARKRTRTEAGPGTGIRTRTGTGTRSRTGTGTRTATGTGTGSGPVNYKKNPRCLSPNGLVKEAKYTLPYAASAWLHAQCLLALDSIFPEVNKTRVYTRNGSWQWFVSVHSLAARL